MNAWIAGPAMALAGWLMVMPGAHAGALEEGVLAHSKGDYATAERLWRPLAEAGDSAAQRELGQLYLHGQGVPRDAAQAYLWLTLAGANMRPGAQREKTLDDRDRVATRLSVRELNEVQARALDWQPR